VVNVGEGERDCDFLATRFVARANLLLASARLLFLSAGASTVFDLLSVSALFFWSFWDLAMFANT